MITRIMARASARFAARIKQTETVELAHWLRRAEVRDGNGNAYGTPEDYKIVRAEYDRRFRRAEASCPECGRQSGDIRGGCGADCVAEPATGSDAADTVCDMPAAERYSECAAERRFEDCAAGFCD